MIRGTGFADVLPVGEPRLLTFVEQLSHLRGPVTAEELTALAEPWKPFRTWAAVLIRAAARHILGDEPPRTRPNPGRPGRRIEGTVAIGAVAPHRAEKVRS